jgi:hypothetical protein
MEAAVSMDPRIESPIERMIGSLRQCDSLLTRPSETRPFLVKLDRTAIMLSRKQWQNNEQRQVRLICLYCTDSRTLDSKQRPAWMSDMVG